MNTWPEPIGHKGKTFVFEKVFGSEHQEMCSKLKYVIKGSITKENILDTTDATAYLLRCDLT